MLAALSPSIREVKGKLLRSHVNRAGDGEATRKTQLLLPEIYD